MDDDDGMLLNFSDSSPAKPSKAKRHRPIGKNAKFKAKRLALKNVATSTGAEEAGSEAVKPNQLTLPRSSVDLEGSEGSTAVADVSIQQIQPRRKRKQDPDWDATVQALDTLHSETATAPPITTVDASEVPPAAPAEAKTGPNPNTVRRVAARKRADAARKAEGGKVEFRARKSKAARTTVPSTDTDTARTSQPNSSTTDGVPESRVDRKVKVAEEKASINAPQIEKKRKTKQVISSLFDPTTLKPLVSSHAARSSMGLGTGTVFSLDSMADVLMDDRLARHLRDGMGLSALTRVQQRTIPTLLSRRDTLIRSATGTGKTLAYAIPMVHDLQMLSPKIKREDGPYAMVVLPTRELALQSETALMRLLKPFIWIVPGVVMGGEKKKSEKSRIRKGINVLIATPGRLLDHVKNTQCLVLSRDEADRLLESGFADALAGAIEKIDAAKTGARNEGRCNVLLSATLDDDIRKLAAISLHNPVVIDCTVEDDLAGRKLATMTAHASDTSGGNSFSSATADVAIQYKTSTRLKQYVLMLPAKLRLVALIAFLKWKVQPHSDGKGIVFFSTRDGITFFHELFRQFGCNIFSCDKSRDTDEGYDPIVDAEGNRVPPIIDGLQLFFLHGGLSQHDRTQVFFEYSNADRGVLFCTDVASRGLHLPRVNWIIQLTAPASAAEYVHRVGRTARLDQSGNAVMFLLPSEEAYLEELKNHNLELVQMTVAEVLSSLVDTTARTGLSEAAKNAATSVQVQCEHAVVRSDKLLAAASAAYKSFISAYTTYPAELKRIFHVKLLHLGHIAKSFALRETPTNTLQESKSDELKRKDTRDKLAQEKKDRAKRRAISGNEFAAGGGAKGGGMSGPKTKKRKQKKK